MSSEMCILPLSKPEQLSFLKWKVQLLSFYRRPLIPSPPDPKAHFLDEFSILIWNARSSERGKALSAWKETFPFYYTYLCSALPTRRLFELPLTAIVCSPFAIFISTLRFLAITFEVNACKFPCREGRCKHRIYIKILKFM